MTRFAGRIALVTGGSAGMGLATARLLASEGARVIITGRDDAKLAAATLAAPANALVPVRCDGAQLADIDALTARVAGEFGRVDALFINAGLGLFKPFTQYTEQDFDFLIGVNYKAAFFTIQRLLPLIPHSGAIVVNASWTLHRGLGNATLGARAWRRGEVQLQLGVGEHHRADVAPLDHSPAALGGPCLLAGTHLGAHLAVGRDHSHRAGDLGGADRSGGIHPVDEHATLADLQMYRSSQRTDRRRVVERQFAAHRGERHRAVHRPGVEVLEAEPLGQGLADGALAGPGRAVDGDDAHYQLVPWGKPSL